jgi:single-strand DNA-binding protein
MPSFNQVILAGNLTRDPQLSYLPSQTAVCDFGLAINRKSRDKDGNQHEEVCFVDVTAFGKQAEIINKHFSKGKPILVGGRLRYREWTKDGQKRSKLEVVMEMFSFIEGSQQAGPAPAGNGIGEPINNDPDIPF